jgi:hypothetical protein
VLVGGVALSAALFAARAQPVSAADVLGQLQAEALSVTVAGAGPCGAPAGASGLHVSGEIVLDQREASAGPTTIASPTELSDRLAQALGVSGDRVREAMLATVRDTLPASLPPDPMTGIAKELGVSREQVCAAFIESHLSGVMVTSDVVSRSGAPANQAAGPVVVPPDGKNVINLSTPSAEELSGPAQRLGVSPDRLAAAFRQAAASLPTPPPPPSPDEIIRRFAQHLGMKEDKVRAAFTQVEGNGRFYFSVPLPGFAR